MPKIDGANLRRPTVNRFFRSALFPLIVIVLLVYLASQTLIPKRQDEKKITLSYLLRNLESREPASLEICALLTKPERREIEVPVRYVGFEIPNRFVIGYGLDFAERYRNLPYIGVLHPDLVPNGL